MLAAAFIARPSVVGRLRRSDRALGQLAEIAASVKQIEQSACEAPSRLELSGQIVRSRGQIESRLQTQQRSIDRLIRKMSVETPAPLDNADVAFSIVRPRRPTNVFVLGTGRCGTVTFSAACGHFDNFTAGHESRRRHLHEELRSGREAAAIVPDADRVQDEHARGDPPRDRHRQRAVHLRARSRWPY